MESIKIIATIIAGKESKSEVLQAIKNVTDGTRKEEGNISYKVHADVKNPNKFVIIEQWRSLADIDIHNETSHFKEFVKAIKGITEDLNIEILREIY